MRRQTLFPQQHAEALTHAANASKLPGTPFRTLVDAPPFDYGQYDRLATVFGIPKTAPYSDKSRPFTNDVMPVTVFGIQKFLA
ncbi:hypothetical protein [Paeniglutamicibacter kerguelensis]|uniref:hypothetical protein n=1 Tax=Paeniglutamicibacter kerguelensis TaxID=254788 RepID=UPI001AEA6C75|nr:hypothetical protein [Paeniglutamicibacter kerguelensis]